MRPIVSEPRLRPLIDGDEAVPPAAHEELVVEDFPFLLDHDPEQQSDNGARSRMPMASGTLQTVRSGPK